MIKRYLWTPYSNIIMRQSSFFGVILILFVGLGWGCSSQDLAMINEVKRFEPQWMDLSEKVTAMQRTLRITELRYPKDLEIIKSERGNGDTDNLLSQYRQLSRQRTEIHERFKTQKEALTKQVMAFNEWETDLMKNRLDEYEARKMFNDFRQEYQTLVSEMDAIHGEMIRNIEMRNSVATQLGKKLDLYQNFTIDVN